MATNIFKKKTTFGVGSSYNPGQSSVDMITKGLKLPNGGYAGAPSVSTPANNIPNYTREQTPQTQAPTKTPPMTVDEMFKQSKQSLQDSASQQQKLAEERQKFEQDKLNSMYAAKRQGLEEQLPGIEQRRKTTEKEVKATLGDFLDQANRQRTVTEDQAGKSLRQLAQSKRELDRGRENLFASLGTVDSSEFRNQQARGDYDLVGSQTELLRDRDNNLALIDKSMLDAREGAKTAIEEAVMQYNQDLRNINNMINATESEKVNAQKEAYLSFNETIGKLQGDLQKQLTEFDMQKAKLMTTKPEYFTNGGQSKDKEQMISAVDTLLAEDLGPITGASQIGSLIPGNPAQKTVNLFNQLQALLSLENRTKLKGSGAISDFEAKTLERAASSLGRNLSETDLRALLEELKLTLNSGQPTQPQQGQQGSYQIGRFTVVEE